MWKGGLNTLRNRPSWYLSYGKRKVIQRKPKQSISQPWWQWKKFHSSFLVFCGCYSHRVGLFETSLRGHEWPLWVWKLSPRWFCQGSWIKARAPLMRPCDSRPPGGGPSTLAGARPWLRQCACSCMQQSDSVSWHFRFSLCVLQHHFRVQIYNYSENFICLTMKASGRGVVWK